jgi:hypothetical protein
MLRKGQAETKRNQQYCIKEKRLAGNSGFSLTFQRCLQYIDKVFYREDGTENGQSRTNH